MLGKIEGRRRRGQQRMRCLDGITDSMDMSLSKEKHKSQTRSSIEAPQLVLCVLDTHLLGPTALQTSSGSLGASGSRVGRQEGLPGERKRQRP